jgi:putative membrane protein
MGPGSFWMGGMWIFPIIMIIVMLICLYLFWGRRGSRLPFRPPWQDSGRYSGESRESETALEILEKRYARGEISKEEFDQMEKDLLR